MEKFSTALLAVVRSPPVSPGISPAQSGSNPTNSAYDIRKAWLPSSSIRG
ncbi:MAG: hypothetical protein HC890_09955 [Chloroflexaceae bacterium]|nr:hypothetical protein [Chloroflexaceae bacterium]